MFEFECCGFIFLIATLLLYGRRINPARRKTIDENVRRIVNSESGTIIILEGIPNNVANEYKFQLKGYRWIDLKYDLRTKRLKLYKI